MKELSLFSFAAGEIELSVQSRPRSPEPVVPEKVQGLEVRQLPEEQRAVSLSWKPPDNMKGPHDVRHYYVRVSSKLSSEVVRNMELDGSVTSVEIAGKDGLELLHEYIFAVQAMSSEHVLGDWNMMEGQISESLHVLVAVSHSRSLYCGVGVIQIGPANSLDVRTID